MLPNASTAQPIVFDGTGESVSFLGFVRRLEESSDRADSTTFLLSKDIEHIVPTHLYGEALRYYEGLDQDCQDDWSRLRDAMASRFPGAGQSSGIVHQSTTQWDEDGLPTLAEAPPLTSSKLAVPAPEPEKEGLFGSVLGYKIPSISMKTLKDKLLVPLFTHLEPQTTVHSFFIEFVREGTAQKPGYTITEVKVDLQDHKALKSAKYIPLLTIEGGNAAGRCSVGYIYTVHYGECSIDFHHRVLSPNAQRNRYTRLMGEHIVSPTRQFKEAIPLTDFTDHRLSFTGSWKAAPGKYIINSHLTSTEAGADSIDRRRLGEITWRIEIT